MNFLLNDGSLILDNPAAEHPLNPLEGTFASGVVNTGYSNGKLQGQIISWRGRILV